MMSDLELTAPNSGRPLTNCYYQTFGDLSPIIKASQPYNPTVSVLIISSLHFGKKNGEHCILLNDNKPDWAGFNGQNGVWPQTQKAANQHGIKVMVMLGGAGGAYRDLFSDFDTYMYYRLLKEMILERTWITGIDLDIEEPVTLDNVKKLIRHISYDFGPKFTITMAPVANALTNNGQRFIFVYSVQRAI